MKKIMIFKIHKIVTCPKCHSEHDGTVGAFTNYCKACISEY